MNCSNLVEATDWVCAPAGRNALRVHAPISLGNDGQLASFYVLEDEPGHFFLTDGHSTILHAIDHGARPTHARLQKIAATPGARFAEITADGEITASGAAADFKSALWDALRLALAISDNEIAWLPKTRQERFASQVARTLRTKLPPGSVISKPRLTGISGHQIEFPLGVLLPGDGGIRAVQPIGVSDDHRIDWGYVYQSYGKLSDLKKATARNVHNRVVVIEPGAPQDEFGRAATVLSEAARVLTFANGDEFTELLMAA
ncbi:MULTISPECIES: hypothetical protein [Pandoraea]|uniref:hypothetical protein n=1 Tax=Pandoraea TaxID=93217 RepID=UPI001AC183E2|nr:hypothetical protein [Pandoraea pnomenusa]MBN9092038.1 hypothetical protein [Pandoraea pnomenusa]